MRAPGYHPAVQRFFGFEGAVFKGQGKNFKTLELPLVNPCLLQANEGEQNLPSQSHAVF